MLFAKELVKAKYKVKGLIKRLSHKGNAGKRITPYEYALEQGRIDALMESLRLLKHRGVPVILVNGPYNDPHFPFAMSTRRRHGIRYHIILSHPQYFRRDLEEIYSGYHPDDYYLELSKGSELISLGKRSVFPERSSELINYVGGLRVTTDRPANAQKTLHCYGACTVAGPWVSDDQTLPSYLQRALIRAGRSDIAVENCAITGRLFSHLANLILDSGKYGPDDIVLLYMPNPSFILYFKEHGFEPLDIASEWPVNDITRRRVYDSPVHPGPECYELMAQMICDKLVESDFKTTLVSDEPLGDLKAYEAFLTSDDGGFQKEAERFAAEVSEQIPAELRDAKLRASIGMNANPFTRGHRYLIEYAASRVDLLFVFCASADTSLFSAEDRLEMMRRGCADLPNVVVASSGVALATVETFPEYFVGELRDDRTEVGATDTRIYGEWVAPALNITKRFVGEELEGSITDRYNKHLASVLPSFGIELVEVPRLEHGDEVVSASTVRRLLSEGRLEELRDIVPPTTYDYIMEMRAKGRI